MFCKIITTTDKKHIPEKLSNELLKNNYSPCIQITNPIESKYYWDGQIKSIEEYKIDIKTLNNLSDKVISLIKKIHNYKTPQIITQQLEIKDKEYKEWILTSINNKGV